MVELNLPPGIWGFWAVCVLGLIWAIVKLFEWRMGKAQLEQSLSANRKLERLTKHLEEKGVITPDPDRIIRSALDPVTVVARIVPLGPEEPTPTINQPPTNPGRRKL